MPPDPHLPYLDHVRRGRELRSDAFRSAIRRLIERLKR
jgi:hypothetical protein